MTLKENITKFSSVEQVNTYRIKEHFIFCIVFSIMLKIK